jgi:hypothetical protein
METKKEALNKFCQFRIKYPLAKPFFDYIDAY